MVRRPMTPSGPTRRLSTSSGQNDPPADDAGRWATADRAVDEASLALFRAGQTITPPATGARRGRRGRPRRGRLAGELCGPAHRRGGRDHRAAGDHRWHQQRGDRVLRAGEPARRARLPGGLVAVVRGGRGAHQSLGVRDRLAGTEQRQARLVRRRIGGGPPAGIVGWWVVLPRTGRKALVRSDRCTLRRTIGRVRAGGVGWFVSSCFGLGSPGCLPDARVLFHSARSSSGSAMGWGLLSGPAGRRAAGGSSPRDDLSVDLAGCRSPQRA